MYGFDDISAQVSSAQASIPDMSLDPTKLKNITAYANSAPAIQDLALSREYRATAYQDTVEDLKKAGINPAYAVMKGLGATQAPAQTSNTQQKVAKEQKSGNILSTILGGLFSIFGAGTSMASALQHSATFGPKARTMHKIGFGED